MSKRNSTQNSIEKVRDEILRCGVCLKAAKGKLVPGEGNSDAHVVFVGEAPGKQEVETGLPFIGRAGKVLHKLLIIVGLTPESVFITSAVKYLPQTYVTPKLLDIEHGRLHLIAQLEIIKPKIVVLLGNTAVMAVLGEKFSIAQSHGTFLERGGSRYFLSYHPAAPLYNPKLMEIIIKDFKKLKKLL